ncbi:hypothetical protein DIPPA_22806 [Diplonema papillatum]|nr:hypothetical protein DIPPA_22806 [Diplonema papillatum]
MMWSQLINIVGHLFVFLSLTVGWVMLGESFYRYALYGSILVSGYTIYANHGSPPISGVTFSGLWSKDPQQLMPLGQYIQRAMAGADFHFLFFSMVWMGAPSNFLVALVLGRKSLWTVSTYLCKNHPENLLVRLYAPLWNRAAAHTQAILEQCTTFEIALGGLVFMQVFTQGLIGFMVVYLHWSFLRASYHSPATTPTKPGALHKRTWAAIGQKVQPWLDSVPILQTPVNYASAWFLSRQ